MHTHRHMQVCAQRKAPALPTTRFRVPPLTRSRDRLRSPAQGLAHSRPSINMDWMYQRKVSPQNSSLPGCRGAERSRGLQFRAGQGRAGQGTGTYLMVRQLPVGPLAVGHHLPHDDAVAPHVAGRGELAVGNGLRGRPADRNLATLQGTPALSPLAVQPASPCPCSLGVFPPTEPTPEGHR